MAWCILGIILESFFDWAQTGEWRGCPEAGSSWEPELHGIALVGCEGEGGQPGTPPCRALFPLLTPVASATHPLGDRTPRPQTCTFLWSHFVPLSLAATVARTLTSPAAGPGSCLHPSSGPTQCLLPSCHPPTTGPSLAWSPPTPLGPLGCQAPGTCHISDVPLQCPLRALFPVLVLLMLVSPKFSLEPSWG